MYVIRYVHFGYQYQCFFFVFLVSFSGKVSSAVASTSDCAATSNKENICEGAVVHPANLLMLMLSLKSGPQPSALPELRL